MLALLTRVSYRARDFSVTHDGSHSMENRQLRSRKLHVGEDDRAWAVGLDDLTSRGVNVPFAWLILKGTIVSVFC
jgi:hypothetical protein